MKTCKTFALNDDAVVVIRFTDRIIKDYADCKKKAAILGPGKNCAGCSLDIPGNKYCLLTMFPAIEEDLEKRMAGDHI